MLHETFYEDCTNNLCKEHPKEFLVHYGLWGKFLIGALVYLNCTKYNEINKDFYHDKKHVTTRTWYEYHSSLVYRARKRIRMHN